MKNVLNLLLIQNEKDTSICIMDELGKSGYEVHYKTVNSLVTLKDILKKKTWDVVISDYIEKDFNTLEALLAVKEHDNYLPFIIMSEEIDCSELVNLMKSGCNNYISKKDISMLSKVIENEVSDGFIKKEKNKQYEKLEHANRNLELTIESIGDGVIITDNEAKIKAINKAAETLTEWDKKSAIGMELDKVFNLINIKNRETQKSHISEVINENLSVGLKEDTNLVSKGGKEFYISANYSKIIDQQNRVFGTIILFRDITRIKTLENELRKEKKQAQAANVAKSAFLASMSHEIRTPLNGIGGMIDLTMLTNLTEEQRENLIIAKECSNSLMEVINNILDFSKIEAGKMEIIKSEFNIKDLIENTVKTNIIHASDKGIDLTFKINSEIDKTYLGDYNKIKQILNNLISNAIKFTNIGKVCLIAEKLSQEQDKELLRFSVSDTGIGISPEDMEKLFKSFSQVDGTYTRKYGGTGLGLLISKKLAELMHGEISVESIKGKGSTFYLTIEIEKSKSLEKPKEFVAYNNLGNNFENISRKILIVEDNKANQEVLSRMCIKMNHKITIADDGKIALEILNSEIFDIILMDIQMPNLNGIETTKIIRENEKKSGGHIPIIALTAYALKGDREKFLKLGMDDYLSKPVIMDDLYKSIESTVSKQKNSTLHNAEYYLDINNVNNNFEDKKICIKKICLEIIKLKELIKKEDFNGCENSTHSIKEYSSNVKSVIMKNASFRAELAARRKDIEGLKTQLKIIEEEYIRIKKLV